MVICSLGNTSGTKARFASYGKDRIVFYEGIFLFLWWITVSTSA